MSLPQGKPSLSPQPKSRPMSLTTLFTFLSLYSLQFEMISLPLPSKFYSKDTFSGGLSRPLKYKFSPYPITHILLSLSSFSHYHLLTDYIFIIYFIVWPLRMKAPQGQLFLLAFFTTSNNGWHILVDKYLLLNEISRLFIIRPSHWSMSSS